MDAMWQNEMNECNLKLMVNAISKREQHAT